MSRVVWSITVDQRAASGGSQRYGPWTERGALACALANALEAFGLEHVEAGDYQLTATSARP